MIGNFSTAHLLTLREARDRLAAAERWAAQLTEADLGPFDEQTALDALVGLVTDACRWLEIAKETP